MSSSSRSFLERQQKCSKAAAQGSGCAAETRESSTEAVEAAPLAEVCVPKSQDATESSAPNSSQATPESPNAASTNSAQTATAESPQPAASNSP